MNTETLLEFPCPFPIKVMGLAKADFEAEVLKILTPHTPEISAADIKISNSSAGKYVSITVNITAQSKQQLDAIYHDLTAHDQVMLAF